MMLDKADIKIIEVELLGVCNLRCPLCLSVASKYKDLFRFNKRPVEEWIEQLDNYPNLHKLVIAGMATEPTLYDQIIELLQYCNSRNIIVRLYTNGNTHDETWWTKLGMTMKKEDECIFTICGATEESHSRYRVGGSLNKLLLHASAFRNHNGNDRCVFIRFEYNKGEEQQVRELMKQFSLKTTINSQTYNEQLNILSDDTGICMEKSLIRKYKTQSFLTKNKGKWKLNCQSLTDKSLVIDNFGKVFPCNYARMNGIGFDGQMKYDEILSCKYDFCHECDENMRSFMVRNKMEGFNGNG